MHSVEKIGGTSMSRFGEVINNVIIGKRKESELYNRIFVVSAYGGITNMLLEHKKTGEAGIYSYFSQGSEKWDNALTATLSKMKEINSQFASIGLDINKANAFIEERMEDARSCLKQITSIRSYGHLPVDEFLPSIRELLASIGEAHSAFNSVLMLQAKGINAIFVDLTGWKKEGKEPLEEVIEQAFSKINFKKTMPVVTGYAKCSEGLMTIYDRGYSEVTFSKIATITRAAEGVIHKEYHLCSADPVLVGEKNVKIIGQTNYDVAYELADIGMEAIHPQASKEMIQKDIPIRIKNVFDPDNEGTLISGKTPSPSQSRVEVVSGMKKVISIQVQDVDMIGQHGYDYSILSHFEKKNISYITKVASGNAITHFVSAKEKNIEECIEEIIASHPSARVSTKNVSIVSVIGSNLNTYGILAKTTKTLMDAKINILASIITMKQINHQYIIEEQEFEKALKLLHKGLVEEEI
jgi:aspartate kinase